MAVNASQPASETEGITERLVAADAATTTSQPWELVVTSKRMKLIAYASAIGVLGLHIFMAMVVAVGDTGAAVTTIDQWAFVGVGLIFAIAALGLQRPRVRANGDGVEVRNFIGTRFYPWSVIYGLSFPKSDRWARLELPEFEFVPMWAFQSADGEAVVQAVAKFRELEDRYMPED
ncbi:PH domain-containing protein [Corynebacterium freiburgense]|uniref:PH domain-containing protein n=1 Tax=Corynebacterium freiburgense TaxID=556548 RepID=UPI000405F2CB|nr:PH domain-containing protein [Corynebacterium freiburgense]WJZ02753.1 hypothetical protein CFREI_07340 [Corynebacterium freiburgense]